MPATEEQDTQRKFEKLPKNGPSDQVSPVEQLCEVEWMTKLLTEQVCEPKRATNTPSSESAKRSGQPSPPPEQVCEAEEASDKALWPSKSTKRERTTKSSAEQVCEAERTTKSLVEQFCEIERTTKSPAEQFCETEQTTKSLAKQV